MKQFTCKECGEHDIEEVIVGVVQYSEINDISQQDGTLSFDYGNNCCEDGGAAESWYECSHCGTEVTYETLKELAD